MKDTELKAQKITDSLIEFYSSLEKGNRNNAIQNVEERLQLRFKDIHSKKEAIELVKYWISNEEKVKENWDVAFLLTQYKVENGLENRMQDLAQKVLGLDTSDKQVLYQVFGELSIRYSSFEVRKRLLRYYRKAYGTRTFFKKDNQTITVDNVLETIDVYNYFILLKQDMAHLEDKYRIPIAHAKNKSELEKAWEAYLRYLSITFYILLLTEKWDKLLLIIENLTGVSFDEENAKLVAEEIGMSSEILEDNTTSAKVLLYLSMVAKAYENQIDVKKVNILLALFRGHSWFEKYHEAEEENLLKKLSNKEAQKLDYLKIFFQSEIVDYLNLYYADAKKYELTCLFNAANRRKSSKEATRQRIAGSQKRSEFLTLQKKHTKNMGKKFHNLLTETGKKGKKSSITELSKQYKISRQAIYNQLYAHYLEIYKKEKNKKDNQNLNEEELFNLVCEKYKIKPKLLINSLEKK